MPALSHNKSLAVNTGAFWPATTEESIRLLQELGLPDIELTLQPQGFYLTFHRELCMPFRSDLMAWVESGSLRVHSVHAPHMSTEHGYSLQARAEYLAHTLRTCQLLGGRVVVVHPFHLFKSYEETQGYLRGTVADVWEVLLPDAGVLLEQAREADVAIALENVKNWADDDTDLFNAPANMRRFIDEVAHPNLSCTLDIVHAWLIGYLDQSLDILADSIVNLHVADLVPPAQRVPPGEGVLVWEELVPVLKSLPHLQQVTIELTRAGHDEIARAADFMLNCWRAL